MKINKHTDWPSLFLGLLWAALMIAAQNMETPAWHSWTITAIAFIGVLMNFHHAGWMQGFKEHGDHQH